MCCHHKISSISWGDGAQIVIALLTIVIIFIAYKQLKSLNSQLKLNFFTDYTKRYQEIILHFPENINRADFSFALLEKKEQDSTMRYMRVYFDLCSEEYYLKKERQIDIEIWNNWESGMKHAFSKKAFKDAWSIVKNDTIYYDEFAKWVDNIMKIQTKNE